MRLMTHNLLACHVKACVATASRSGERPLNFPLRIELSAVEGALMRVECEFEPAFVLRLLPKLDWPALAQTASQLGIAELPAEPPASPAEDEAFLRSVHTLTQEVHIMEGALVCPHCGRRYPVSRGIPNMMLVEDEV